MDCSLEVNDNDINDLKSKIDAQRKIHEYEKLKKDLFDITYQSTHALTEFDGGMQQIDTDKSLKTIKVPDIINHWEYYRELKSRSHPMINTSCYPGIFSGEVSMYFENHRCG
jgi:hypothetical protein